MVVVTAISYSLASTTGYLAKKGDDILFAGDNTLTGGDGRISFGLRLLKFLILPTQLPTFKQVCDWDRRSEVNRDFSITQSGDNTLINALDKI